QTAPKLRLPTTVRPLHYTADLHVTPGQDAFTGKIVIDLELSQPVETIWLHSKSLTFDDLNLKAADGEKPAKAMSAENDFVAITTGSTTPAGPATLTISYKGKVSRTLTDGAFQQEYNKDWYVFTKFEPVTARRVFPCFDEPSFKVPWQLTLHLPKDLKAFSN